MTLAPPVAPADDQQAAETADAVDRYLCSYSYLRPAFARYLAVDLVEPSLRALGPACGVDLVAVARHAVQARRRHLALTGLLLAHGAALVLLTIVFGAATWWAGPVLGAVGLCGASAFAVVIGYDLATQAKIRAIMNKNNALRDLAGPLDDATEAQLAEAMAANTVVFSGGDPFVGSGLPLKAWQLTMDVSKPATDAAGNRRTVVAFEAVDLHRELTVAVRSAGIPGLQVHNRLFVGGAAAHLVPGLLPDPRRRPQTTVARKTVRLGIERPRPDARTYLSVEITGWAGELVVSLYVRAVVVGSQLFVEGHAHVLLPLRAEVCAAENISRSTAYGVASAVVRGIRLTPQLIVSSPRVLFGMARNVQRRRRVLSQQRRRVRQGQLFDYGATTSIRQVTADTERVWLFAYADEEMYLNILRDRILEAIRRFLDDHGIDAAEFQTQRNNISMYQIGSILGANVAFGNGAQITTVQAGAGTPPQGGAAGQAPTPAPWEGSP